MAAYTAVNGALLALERLLDSRLPDELANAPVNGRVELWGSEDINGTISGNVLGIYLHRIEIDPLGRSRSFAQQGPGQKGITRELPVNLHILLVASARSATNEANLLAWAMVQLANESHLDISHMKENDGSWTEKEMLTVTPEDMANEDLMRIWDALDKSYTSSVPYVVRTLRLRLKSTEDPGPPVTTRIFPGGEAASE